MQRRITVTLDHLLAPVLGGARAAVASALVGWWVEAVAIGVRSTEDALARKRFTMLRAVDIDIGADAPVTGRDGQEMRYATNAEDALTLDRLEEVDLLVVDLLSSRPGISRLSDVVRRLHAKARVLLVVPSAWLHSTAAATERSELLHHAGLRAVVDLGTPPATRDHKFGSSGNSVHFPVALALLGRAAPARATYFATFPGGPTPTEHVLERFLRALDPTSTAEERNEWGFSLDIARPDVWDPGWLRPERDELVADLLERGGARPLEAFADVMPGRRPPRDSSGPPVRVLQAKDISARLPAVDAVELMASTPGRTLVAVRAGDVVGSISGPKGRWAIVPEDYEDVFAGDHTVVLRLRPGAELSARYLLAWLESDTAAALFVTRGATIARLDLRHLREIPVPAASNVVAAAVDQLADIDEADHLLSAQLESLRAGTRSMFAGIHPGDVARRLAELSDLAATTTAGLRRHEDLIRRVQDLYPYPVARNVRQLRLARDPRVRYDEIMNVFDSLLFYVSTLALSWARALGVQTKEQSELAKRVRQNGASHGVWLATTRAIAGAAAANGHELDGLASAISAKGRTSLDALLGDLLAERNKVHGDKPQNDYAYSQRVDGLLPILKMALEASTFLVRGKLVWVSDISPVETNTVPLFKLRTELAMGDHPDWDVTEQVVDRLVYEERFYLLRDNGEPVQVSPYLAARRCFVCLQRHVYYLDKMRSAQVTLNSIDRGHRRIDEDPTLVQELASAYPTPPTAT